MFRRGDVLVRRFQFVADNSATYEVKRLCELVQVPRSSYYAWITGAQARAARAAADAALAARIRAVVARTLSPTSGVLVCRDDANLTRKPPIPGASVVLIPLADASSVRIGPSPSRA